MRTLAALVVSAMLTLAVPQAAGAQASPSYYGKAASVVAKQIGCKNFRVNRDTGDYASSAGICYLRGMRVNLLTFPKPDKQINWVIFGKAALPSDYYFAAGNGAAVVAKNGNRPAAVAGARAILGKLYHGS